MSVLKNYRKLNTMAGPNHGRQQSPRKLQTRCNIQRRQMIWQGSTIIQQARWHRRYYKFIFDLLKMFTTHSEFALTRSNCRRIFFAN